MRSRGTTAARIGRASGGEVPPPPGADPVEIARPRAPGPRETHPDGASFTADVDVGELDERQRPGMPWTARCRRLSTSGLVFVSRRMCYEGRYLAVAVHLIDAHPVALLGRVGRCEYDGGGLYEVQIELVELPLEPHPLHDWVQARSKLRRA